MDNYRQYTPLPNRYQRVGNGVIAMHLSDDSVTFIDEADLPTVVLFRWTAQRYETGRVYVFTHLGHGLRLRKRISLHRVILDAPDGLLVDHRDGDPLNNRRSNLRICTRSQNGANATRFSNNTSGYKGVSWHRRTQRWRAYIMHQGRQRWIGVFETPEEAAHAYDDAARNLFGPFATLNFPLTGERAA